MQRTVSQRYALAFLVAELHTRKQLNCTEYGPATFFFNTTYKLASAIENAVPVHQGWEIIFLGVGPESGMGEWKAHQSLILEGRTNLLKCTHTNKLHVYFFCYWYRSEPVVIRYRNVLF